jgi:phospholipid/cholesterol/gamma-HCH transport system substrate-binding protein
MEPEAKYTLVGGSVLVLLALLGRRRRLARVGEPRHRRAALQDLLHPPVARRAAGAQRRAHARHPRRRGHRLLVRAGPARARSRSSIGIDPATPVKDSTRAVVDRNLITGLATIRLQNLTEDSLPIARPAPGKADPVIAEGASQLQQFSETANELARRADETMRRINTTLSNENQAAAAETLVSLRDLSQKRGGRGERGPTPRCCRSPAPPTRSARHRRARPRRPPPRRPLDTLGAEAGTTLRDASAAMRQISGDVSSCPACREPARRQQRRSAAHQPAAARHGRRGEHRGAQVPRPRAAFFGPGEASLGPGESR